MNIKPLNAEQFETRLIALDALKEGSRYKEATSDQKYVAQIHAMLLFSIYSDVDADNIPAVHASIYATYMKIVDINLKSTIKDLIFV